MPRRRWTVVIGLVTMAIAAAGIAVIYTTAARPTDPLGVVRAWNDARSRGDVDEAMAYLGPTGNIFGVAVHVPAQRQDLATIFAAQAVAGWSVEDAPCEVSGETVTCRYVQRDLVLDRLGLTLTGRHRYIVRDGTLAFAERIHDPQSRDVAYAAFAAFRDWVLRVHPELVDVIWSDPTAALYSTPDGARAALAVLDEYLDSRTSRISTS